MDTFYIKQNDTSPSIEAQLLDSAGEAVDLTGATVVANMSDTYGEVVVKQQSVNIVNALEGIVRYHWQSGDTRSAGNNYLEFQVTFNNGLIQTFPNNGNISVRISPEVN